MGCHRGFQETLWLYLRDQERGHQTQKIQKSPVFFSYFKILCSLMPQSLNRKLRGKANSQNQASTGTTALERVGQISSLHCRPGVPRWGDQPHILLFLLYSCAAWPWTRVWLRPCVAEQVINVSVFWQRNLGKRPHSLAYEFLGSTPPCPQAVHMWLSPIRAFQTFWALRPRTRL